MLPKRFRGALVFVCVCLGVCSASGVEFVEDDIFVQMRSEGEVTAGYLGRRRGNDDLFHDKVLMTFTNLRFLTPNGIDLYMFPADSELWDIQESALHEVRGIGAHGMSMELHARVLGLVLNMTGAIFKEDGQLTLGGGASIDVRQGEVLVTLTLTPANDLDLECLPCGVDDGYVVQLGFDVNHVGDEDPSDVIASDVFHMYYYESDSFIFFPKQFLSDDKMEDLDIDITHSEGKYTLLTRLASPLGDFVQLSFLMKIKEPTEETTTILTTSPEPEPTTTRKPTTTEFIPRDVDIPRDSMVEDDEPRVIEVKYITMTTTKPIDTDEISTEPESEPESVVNSDNNGGLSHYVSSLLLYVLSVVLYAFL